MVVDPVKTASVSVGLVALLAAVPAPCPASPTFLAAYPCEGDDFLRGSMEVSAGYWLFGSVPASGSGDSRILAVDPYGVILLDSLPPCESYAACLSPDGCIVSAFAQDGMPVIRMDSQTGSPVWLRQYPAYPGCLPAAITPRPGGGYLAAMGGSSGSLVLGLDPGGNVKWDAVIPASTPTAISAAPGDTALVSVIVTGGSGVVILDPDGQTAGGFDCPGLILRDIEPFQGDVALAAVGSGVILCDRSGLQAWQYSPPGVEVFGLVVSGDRLAAAGSIMEGSARRSFLALLDADGAAVWERSYGYGDSFRSISVSPCSDGGFCSVGGYDEGISLGSFAIRTDSLGLVWPDGVGGQEPAPGTPVLTASCNPSTSSIWITYAGGPPPERLLVFDCSGRLVESLSPTDGGRFLWDGSGESGMEAPAGVYLVSPASGHPATVLRLVRL